MILFEIPDSYSNRKINLRLIELLKEHPEYFYKGIDIEAVYGCPPFCIWNAGCGNLPYEDISLKGISNIFKKYEAYNIPYRLTFSNFLLNEQHMQDTYGNAIAKLGNKRGNAVIVASNVVEKYITEHYSNYEIIYSISRLYKSIDEINVHIDQYKICLPIWMNHEQNLLGKLKTPSNAIILVNEYCPVTKCEFCKEHYISICRTSLYQSAYHHGCKHQKEKELQLMRNKVPTHNVSPLEYESFQKLGIYRFKISGRSAKKEQLVNTYILYFIKPSYAFMIKDYLMDD